MNYLEYIPVWPKLEADQRRLLLANAAERTFAKGQPLHSGGENCTGLFLVCRGQLRAYTMSDDGREITLYRLFDRDMCLFSASCMMNSIQFDVSIRAEKDTRVLHIPTDVYKEIMQVSAPLANYTNEVMASRFSDVMWLIDQIMWKSFDRRLADFLLNETAIDDSKVLAITHEVIGNHLGSPREVVTRMLKYFQNEGLVKLSRGTVEILNSEGLSRLAAK